MKTIQDIEITKEHLSNKKFKFQYNLTTKLDAIATDFNQEIINEIVLWKVNRYVEMDPNTLSLLNQITKGSELLNRDFTREILENLLNTKGIQLAMASTILRFKNPNIYQIIDQRVYRLIFEKNMPRYFASVTAQVDCYLEYLEKLNDCCKTYQIDF